jgi:hypothetical protein
LSRKNVRSGASLALLALLCCAAPAVRAGETTEITTDLTVENDYDSNILFKENNPRGSAITIVRPEIHLDDHGTLGHVNLGGYLSSHTFWEESELDGVDRGVSLDFDRTLLPRWSVFGSGSFQRIAAHDEIRGPATVSVSNEPGVPTEPVLQPGQLVEGAVPNVDLGQGQFGFRYLLSPRSKLSLSAGPFLIDYLSSPSLPHSGFRDRDGYFANLTLDRSLSSVDSLSFSLDANTTNFNNVFIGVAPSQNPNGAPPIPINTGTTESDLQSFSVGWNRTWNELWTTSISLGARRLETVTRNQLQQATRLAVTPSGVTAFADFVETDSDNVGPGAIGAVSIQRLFSRGLIAASYSRETRTTSSVSASNVNVDAASLTFKWRLAEYVTFSANGDYEHYESADKIAEVQPAQFASFNPITGAEFSCNSGFQLSVTGSGLGAVGQCVGSARSKLTSDLWTASARVDWQLRKRLFTFAVLRFTDRSGDPALFGNPYDKWNVGVGFRYDYAWDF